MTVVAARTGSSEGAEGIAEPNTGSVADRLAARLSQRRGRLFNRLNLNLLVELTRAQMKVGDQDSPLGVVWSLLNPAATLAVMYAIFSTRFGAEIPAYPLYLLLGIVLVSFFTSATRQMISMIPSQRTLLANTTVPTETLAIARISTTIYKLVIDLVLCACLSAWYGLLSLQMVLLVLPLLVAYIALTLGIGFILCMARAFSRDSDYLWSVASRVLFFGTPIFYTLDSTAPAVRTVLYWLNPVTPFVLSFRELLMGGGQVEWGSFGHSLIIGSVALVVGYISFALLEYVVVERA